MQSAALKLICDRENEITAFVPEEYWYIAADFGKGFVAELSKISGKKAKVTSAEQAEKIKAELEGEAAAHDPERLKVYATTDSPEYQKMVQIIQERFGLTSLKFTKLEDLIEAIGLDKSQVCTHCFDGSSEYTLHEENLGNK